MSIDYDTFAVLSGLRTPISDSSRAVVIEKGKLADLVIRGLQLSDADYYGLFIAYRGGALWKKEMRQLALRDDFPA